jgi:class 3 adenylate cyclase
VCSIRLYVLFCRISSSQYFPTVVLFADVSGFSKLSESLAKKGSLGAEELAIYLNAYLERMLKIIHRSGGDVLKFAGDALLCLMLPDSGAINPKPDEIATMVHRAAQVRLFATCFALFLVFIRFGFGVMDCAVLARDPKRNAQCPLIA